MLGSLMQLRIQGWQPAVVIDVGAQVGTEDLWQAFPDARHLMIEPVEENREALDAVASRLKDAEVIIAAVESVSGEALLNVSPNSRYSSIVSAEKSAGRTDLRKVPQLSVDDLCRQRALAGPYLLKVDVDGRELHVLRGATETLSQTGCAIVETVMFDTGPNYFYAVADFMKQRGFVIHDIVNPFYRPNDFALWQVDTVFVPSDSACRSNRDFADADTTREILAE
jgi:FkbM family methyltransferase